MSLIFELIDKTRRRVRLTKERWEHILEHKGMENYLEDIKIMIERPEKIVPHDDASVNDYYKYYKHKKSKNKFLKVVVKYLNGDGYILSAYFVPKITY